MLLSFPKRAGRRKRTRGVLAATAAAFAGAAREPFESLERRLLMSVTSESEPNDSAATANVVNVSSPAVINASMPNGDVDYFKFTLSQRSGVFFDIDSIETGLSNSLDTVLTLYDGSGANQIDTNDDGRDFETFSLNDNSATPLVFGDSSLYDDLAAGTYVLGVSAYAGGSGNYQLKITADSTYSSSVPVLSSKPGAADTLYLDFDGHAATDVWGTYNIPAYDLNGNAAEWTPAEKLAIQNIWSVVADDFSPFDINVTTSYGGSYSPDATGYRMVIGNGNGAAIGAAGAPGAAITGSYAAFGVSSKTSFVFASNFQDVPDAGVSGQITAAAIEIANTVAQQFGRALGLGYYGGVNSQPAGIMQQSDFGLNRERWVSGNTMPPASVLQDDVAIISSATNTFGYRADDHGNSRAAATLLSASGNSYIATGVIAQTSDVDYFRFTASGSTSIALDASENLGHLDGVLSLYNASGTLILSSDPAGTLSASISTTLAAGTYYVAVASHGGAGQIGQYNLRIDTTPVLAPTGGVSGRVFRDVTLNNTYESGAGDTPIAGVSVFIDANHNGALDSGESSTTTAADGTYAFAALPDGSYDVREITPAGYVADLAPNFVIGGGEVYASGGDFGNFPIVYTGGTGDDTYTLRLKSGDASTAEIAQTLGGGSAVTYAAPKNLLPSLTFTGGDGNDTLNLSSAMPFAVNFSGGTNALYTDHLNVNAGTFTFNADAKLTTANLSLSVGNASAAVIFNATQHLESLSITAGTATMSTNGDRILCTDTLVITAGQLDLRDNDMIIRSGDIGSLSGQTYTGVQGLIQSGYDFGGWDGTGITTTMPGAIAGQEVLGAAMGSDVLGLDALQSDLWEGQTVSGASILIKYTYGGDGNLDGAVTGDDYFQIDSGFPAGASGWINGDFNYDGSITGDDYFVIDSNFPSQGPPL